MFTFHCYVHIPLLCSHSDPVFEMWLLSGVKPVLRLPPPHRAINLLPNRVLGSVGQHVGEPVEQIARSRDSRFLASCAHDQLVKFWDVSGLPDMEVSDYRRRKKKGRSLRSLSKKAFGTGDDFFSGLAEETGGGGEKEEEEREDGGGEDSDSGSD